MVETMPGRSPSGENMRRCRVKVCQTMAALCGLLGTALGDRGVLHGAEVKAISPPGAKVAGPYTPGLLAGGFLYVSGQGARDSRGRDSPDYAGSGSTDPGQRDVDHSRKRRSDYGARSLRSPLCD